VCVTHDQRRDEESAPEVSRRNNVRNACDGRRSASRAT
jgi:hypothetical protein